jgi:hypothetical protein
MWMRSKFPENFRESITSNYPRKLTVIDLKEAKKWEDPWKNGAINFGPFRGFRSHAIH